MKKFWASFAGIFLIFISNIFSQDEFQYITVNPGDTLWSISQKYLKDPTKWDIIVKHNNLPADPSRALAGMRLKVPVSLIKEEFRAARFSEIVNDVRFRKKEISRWKSAEKRDELFKGDTVRTNSDSMADVRFYTGQILSVFSNSMLVIRPPEQKNTDIKLMSGHIRAVNSRVITPTAKIIPKTGNTEFGARIKDDLSTTVEVYKGVATVSSKDKEIEVKEGFSSEVKLNMAPSEPIKMPKIESLSEMKTRISSKFNVKIQTSAISSIPGGSTIRIGQQGEIKIGTIPAVNQNISQPIYSQGKPLLESTDLKTFLSLDNASSGYRIQVSRDQNFAAMVFNRKYDVFTRPDFAQELPKGAYWVRYAVIDLLGDEGKFSEPRQMRVR